MKRLKIEDLSYLNMLLKTGMPIKNCVLLLKNNTNKDLLNDIIEGLDNGELIENTIAKYIPKDINDFLKPLLHKLSFQKSLELSLIFYEKINDNRKEIINKCLYPLVLLFASITALFLFDLLGLDTIFGLLETFKQDLTGYRLIRIIIRTLIYIFYFSVIIISLVIMYMTNRKRIIIFYEFIVKYFKNSLFNLFYSEELISLYLMCKKAGYQSKDSFEILKSLTSKPIISFLAFHLNEELIRGVNFDEAFKLNIFDELLSNYIRIASYTNDFEEVMKNYVTLTSLKIKNRIKKYTNVLQLSVYAFCAFVIVFVYEILYLPMSAITTF